MYNHQRVCTGSQLFVEVVSQALPNWPYYIPSPQIRNVKYLINDDSHPTFLFAPQIVERAYG